MAKTMTKITLYASLLSVLFLGSCSNKKYALKTAEANNYQILGDSLAMASQKALIGVLTKTITKSGTTQAIEFCNANALKMVDSLSQRYNCTIQRVSDKYRNPADQPLSKLDKAILGEYKTNHLAGKKLISSVNRSKNQTYYYKPITIAMPTCLKCHGDKSTDIEAATLQKIQELYPNDQAFGYKQGDFRGVWKITFNQK